MGRNSSKANAIANMNLDEPKNPRLLGEIRVDPNEHAPLGGLNPYSHHFDKIGGSFMRLLIEHARLNKKRKVLDLGCGTGRLAKRFHRFLEGGSYEGLDNNQHFIDYCQSTYTGSKFNFTLSDIQHDEYNPNGKIQASDFKFPYKDNSFDLVCAIALFNHFETPWVFNYISEISRVLNPNGIFFGTFLILNKKSMEHIDGQKKHPFKFDVRNIDSWHEYTKRTLFNVAVPEPSLRRCFMKYRLMIREPIRYGEWCSSPIAITGHDVVVAIKGSGWGSN